jgi:IS30 family transposase
MVSLFAGQLRIFLYVSLLFLVGLKSGMGRNKSTISRELSRNTGKRGYRHKQANRLADERHQEKNKAIKLTDSVKNYKK